MAGVNGRHVSFTMDVEEWYDYFFVGNQVSIADGSVLEGAHRFLDLTEELGFKTTFFVLDHIVRSRRAMIVKMVEAGHEVASHGSDHRLLSTVGDDEFRTVTASAKRRLEDVTGRPVLGYRAPSLSITEGKLNILHQLGFKYDSSVIDRTGHPLYGHVDLVGWVQRSKWVYERDGFFEIKIPTTRLLRRNVPVAGGGYMRLIPWPIFRALALSSMRTSESHIFYVHPFECNTTQVLPSGMRPLARLRFQLGRGKALRQVREMARRCRTLGFQVGTCSALVEKYRTGGAEEAEKAIR